MLLLGLVATLLPPARRFVVPDRSVIVDLLSEQQVRALYFPRPEVKRDAGPAPAPPPPQQDTAQPDNGMIRATRLLSASALANPLSRQAREALPMLAFAERREQLCNIEAMEQLHAHDAAHSPDRVVAYARTETQFEGRDVIADGAAIRSNAQWYELVYLCTLSAAGDAVEAFEFRLGAPIPQTDWEYLNLPAKY